MDERALIGNADLRRNIEFLLADAGAAVNWWSLHSEKWGRHCAPGVQNRIADILTLLGAEVGE